MTQVDLHHLSKTYRNSDTPAVHNLNLAIPAGQITALLGPSGCGKTTVLKMIAGLIQPGEGEVMFNGKSVLSIPTEKREVAMVFQNYLLFPHMSVGDNVGFGLKMRGVKPAVIEQRVAEMLALVKLTGMKERRPNQLSGGQQQRVALARALIIRPRLLLLDEPLSNLDAHLRGEMRDLILDIQRRLKLTTIFVTHDQEEAVVLADHIALLLEGQLQQYGPPTAFYERPRSERVARFFGGVNFVPGVKRGHQFETALGLFRCPAQNLPDGPALLTIRPENIEFRPNGRRENVAQVTIQSSTYLGTHARFKLATGTEAAPLEVVANAGLLDRFYPGQAVRLYFPPEKIWLVPGSEAHKDTAPTEKKPRS